jgi:predicted lipid-binding transport protein (Tim44 family)
MEPGLGLALLAVLVMLLVTAVLAGLIYLLMIAISPIDQRTPRSRTSASPVVEQQAPPTQAAQPAPAAAQ